MKLRTKLKRARQEIIRQNVQINGLERGNRYLSGLCKRIEEKKNLEIDTLRTTKNILRMILDRIAVEAGEIEISTADMKILEQYEITYLSNPKTHKIKVKAEKKEEQD